jgi:hypothetical protein
MKQATEMLKVKGATIYDGGVFVLVSNNSSSWSNSSNGNRGGAMV